MHIIIKKKNCPVCKSEKTYIKRVAIDAQEKHFWYWECGACGHGQERTGHYIKNLKSYLKRYGLGLE